jgi:hypothetical protein
VEVTEGEWGELMGRLSAVAGVRRAVGLWRSKRVVVPLTFGVRRPVIVVPREAMGWSEERRRMALLHELAHIRRGDCLTQLLLRCVRAWYWFHPLAWVACAAAQAECERACDDRVLTAGMKSSTYAEALMEYAAPLMRGGRGGKVPTGALAMARAATLEGRLLAILDAARNRRGVTWRAGVGVLALVAGMAAGLGMLRARGATSATGAVATTREAAKEQADAFVVYEWEPGYRGPMSERPLQLLIGTIGRDGGVTLRTVVPPEGRLTEPDGPVMVSGGKLRWRGAKQEAEVDLATGKETLKVLAPELQIQAGAMGNWPRVNGNQTAGWQRINTRTRARLRELLATMPAATQATTQPAVVTLPGFAMGGDPEGGLELVWSRHGGPGQFAGGTLLEVKGDNFTGMITNVADPMPPVEWVDEGHVVTLYTSADQKGYEVVLVDVETKKVTKLGKTEGLGTTNFVVTTEDIGLTQNAGMGRADGTSMAKLYAVARAEALAGTGKLERRAMKWGDYTLGGSVTFSRQFLAGGRAADAVSAATFLCGEKDLGGGGTIKVSADGKRALWVSGYNVGERTSRLYYMDSREKVVRELKAASGFEMPVWTAAAAVGGAATGIATTRAAVDVETLVARCAPDRPVPAGMDGFEDLLKLRETRDWKAVGPLVKVLEAHLGSTRIHGFAAAQALYMIGGRDAEAALTKYLLMEDRFPAGMAYDYAFWWQMPEPQRSGFLEKYVLQNMLTNLAVRLEAKAGPGADEVTFGVTIKNTSAVPMDLLDDQGWVGDSLYLRAGERFADKDKRREDKRPPSWVRLAAGQERRFSAVGKVGGVEQLRGKDRRVTAEVVQMLEVDGTFFYLPKGEVRGYAMVTMAGITEEQKKIAGGKADQAWAGRSVSGAVAVAVPGRAGATAPGQVTVNVPLKNAAASDVARLINAMFRPGGAGAVWQQAVYAEADDRTNTVVLTGPADQVKQAKGTAESVEKLSFPGNVPLNDLVYFRMHLKTLKAVAAEAALTGRHPEKFKFVADPDTETLWVSCDRHQEDAIRTEIEELDRAAETKPATATTRAGASTMGALSQILEDLKSADYGVRAAALKRLEQVGAEQRDVLAKMAKEASNPEVQARLLARVEAIDAAVLPNLPGITLSVQKASLESVTATLTKATGIVFSVQLAIPAAPGAGLAAVPTVTLNAKDRPLWEVIRDLNAQTPLRYLPSTSGVRLTPQGNGPAEPAPQVAGPLIFYPNRPVAGVAAGDAAGGIRLQLTAFADPRMDLMGERLDFTEATDDKGNKLALLGSNPGAIGGTGSLGPRDYARVNHFVWAVTVSPPAEATAKVNLKGTARLLLVDTFATKTVEMPEKHLGEALEVGGRTVTITRFETTPTGRLRCEVTVTPAPVGALPAPPDARLAAGTAETSDVRYTVLDAAGQALTNQTAPSPSNRLMATGQEPFRVVISAPLTWKAVTVPVELRDLER